MIFTSGRYILVVFSNVLKMPQKSLNNVGDLLNSSTRGQERDFFNVSVFEKFYYFYKAFQNRGNNASERVLYGKNRV